jgi:hypothetical protein
VGPSEDVRLAGQRAATHSLRAYLGSDIDFDAVPEDATTTGSALICISGHIAG